ncbi:MAG: hypothetical protein AMJ42_01485, partial [Deltaproteobacteria bacterium DG_8]
METLGEYLKNKREARNITLEEVAKVTKIRRGILEAIESNRHDLLPPRVFTQGFLKNYASYLGLDESEVVKRYQEALERLEVKKDKGESKGKETAKRVSSPTRILVLFTVFVIALAFWFFSLPQSKRRIFILKNSQQKTKVESIKLLPIEKSDILEEEGEEEEVKEEKELDFSGRSAVSSGVKETGEVEAEQMVLRVL